MEKNLTLHFQLFSQTPGFYPLDPPVRPPNFILSQFSGQSGGKTYRPAGIMQTQTALHATGPAQDPSSPGPQTSTTY